MEFYAICQKEGKRLEIIYVSWDRSKTDFINLYKKGLGCLAIKYEDRIKVEQLNEQFGVSTIPKLIVLDNQGKLVKENGIFDLGKGTGAFQEWTS
jgi:thioredoxin-related protein